MKNKIKDERSPRIDENNYWFDQQKEITNDIKEKRRREDKKKINH
jgi:hypothetical protein